MNALACDQCRLHLTLELTKTTMFAENPDSMKVDKSDILAVAVDEAFRKVNEMWTTALNAADATTEMRRALCRS
jgi:hypothetical protein